MSSTAVIRSARAERIRTAGVGRLWTVLVPAAVLTPLAISVGIAAVAEAFARIPGQLSVLQVSTSNAGYWVITITLTMVAIAAADGQSSESRYRTAEYVSLSMSPRWSVAVGRWLFYGLLGVALTAVAMLVALTALPAVSPHVYGTVSVTDSVGRRLVWTTALLAFFAAGAGIGVGALVRSPLGAGAVIVAWAYVLEAAAGYLPGGLAVQPFMPALNAGYATGQDTVLLPPWSRDIALLYACCLCVAVFGLGAAASRSPHMSKGRSDD